MRLSRAIGLGLGYVAGRLIEQPIRSQPAAAFQQAASAVEERSYVDDAGWGTVHVGALVGAVAALGVVAERLTRKRPVLHALATAVATAVVLEDTDSEPGSLSTRGMVGPLVYGAAFGIPGLLGYRAVHTVADQLGTGDEKYANFGRSASSLRDVADYLPDHLTEKLNALK